MLIFFSILKINGLNELFSLLRCVLLIHYIFRSAKRNVKRFSPLLFDFLLSLLINNSQLFLTFLVIASELLLVFQHFYFIIYSNVNELLILRPPHNRLNIVHVFDKNAVPNTVYNIQLGVLILLVKNSQVSPILVELEGLDVKLISRKINILLNINKAYRLTINTSSYYNNDICLWTEIQLLRVHRNNLGGLLF